MKLLHEMPLPSFLSLPDRNYSFAGRKIPILIRYDPWSKIIGLSSMLSTDISLFKV